MQHVDPDRLVLLALGEAVADPTESSHVAQCTACRDDLDATREVAESGRLTQDLTDLPHPPPRVWRGIAAATGVSAEPATPYPVKTAWPTPSPRRWRSRLRVPALVAATAAAAVALTLAVPRLVDRPPAEQVAATADLAAIPAAQSGVSGVNGVARVLDGADGERLHLHVTGLPLRPGYYEVWLINPDTSQMVSVGVLRDRGDELLPLPSTIDLRRYRLVDVSAEDYNGDVTHSGRSLLRGTLAG
jgi:Anti-sigma-K factor rskA